MKNRFIINDIQIKKNRISYDYSVVGDWQQAFNPNDKFFVEYNIDISSVPESIAVIPILANVLPMAWVYDAEIVTPVCDEAFLKCIPKVKKGYREMYPMINFGGKITSKEKQTNHYEKDGGTGSFFSGGVDAFSTLVNHASESPTLITLWGADIKLEDNFGWENVKTHLAKTAEEFDVDYVTVKSSFRKFIKEGFLSRAVKDSKDGWWHGFQHGLGIISHAAPIAYLLNKKSVYIASSFHVSQKGQYTCASDPTIDNHIRFADTKIVHDGYEYTRQDKIKIITDFSRETTKKIPLRVCWESVGGGNCCSCEKCFRTIMGIYAQGFNPNDFGFDFTEKEFKRFAKKMRYSSHSQIGELRYGPIQDAMKKNCKRSDLPREIRWFYSIKKAKIGTHPFLNFLRRIKAFIKKTIRRFI